MNRLVRMKPLLIFLQLFAALSLQILCNEALQEAKSTGDIIIGGLFPIHESVNDKGECDRYLFISLKLLLDSNNRSERML